MVNVDLLHSLWKSLTEELDPSNEYRSNFNKYWDIIITNYSENHRYYHNLQHISECLDHYKLIRLSLENQLLVQIALWFHDIVYKPKSRNNEQDSNEVAQRFANSINLRSDEKTQISNLILGTIKHNQVLADGIDIQYMIDIDLAILGSETGRFWQYEAQIAKEYSYAPLMLYKRTRRKIMKKFLDRDDIYATKYFKDRYENSARSNIQNLLDFYTNN